MRDEFQRLGWGDKKASQQWAPVMDLRLAGPMFFQLQQTHLYHTSATIFSIGGALKVPLIISTSHLTSNRKAL